MEITFERVLLWLILGVFICYKRDWYSNYGVNDDVDYFICIIAIILTPINFLIVFFKMFFINKWDN